MKWIVSLGLIAAIIMLGVVAYQVNRTTWSAEDQECHGLFTSAGDEALCKRAAQENAAEQAALNRLSALTH